MSLEISKVKGVPIKLHFTLIIILALLSWTLSSGFMPRFYPNLDPLLYWIMGIAGAITLIFSILLHELAHVIMSLKYGLEVRQIILFVFGGVADIKEETKEYKKEFRIALVGPLASFGLALFFLLLWYIIFLFAGNDALPSNLSSNMANMENSINFENFQQESFSSTFVASFSGILVYSIVANALVGAFNLLPAFPLDGGRMLRALLIKRYKNYDQATRTAVKLGTGISFGLIAYGFITIFTGSAFGGLWFIIIGWFLQTAAQSYLQQHEISRNLAALQLKDVMITDFVYVRPDLTVGQVTQIYFNVYRKSEFPVLDEKGYLVGSVSNKQINNDSSDKYNDIPVAKIMSPVADMIIMNKSDRADEALRQMYQRNKNRVYVGNNLNKNKIINGHTMQPLSSTSSPGYDQFIKVNLEGIISKTDLLNIARNDEKS
jgi:Zn-dependent protease/CBS domain-containing protein